jgi:TPR repeat protein
MLAMAAALGGNASAQVSGGSAPPRIAVLSTLVAEPSSQMPLQIRIAPIEAIPRNSFLRLRGLPPTASLSPGHAIAPGSWAVPLNGLAGLTLSLPAAVSGRSELIISLVGEDGALLAETRMALVVEPVQAPAAPPKAAPQAAAPATLPKPAPAATPADREAAEKLLARGDRDLEQGNIAVARQFYQRAAQMGLARAALMLAATYDPRELVRLRAVSVQPNVAEARKWYERAIELGAPEAKERLATLGGGG